MYRIILLFKRSGRFLVKIDVYRGLGLKSKWTRLTHCPNTGRYHTSPSTATILFVTIAVSTASDIKYPENKKPPAK
jgi:hypothetical protein